MSERSPLAPGQPSAFVTVSPKAVEFARRHREKLGLHGAALRLGVKGGGCAGLTYVTDFTLDPPKPRELVLDYEGLQVYLDPRCQKYLDGAVLDYENTLMWQGFKWHNPQQDAACGCGLTFTAKAKPELGRSDAAAESAEPANEAAGERATQGAPVLNEKRVFRTL